MLYFLFTILHLSSMEEKSYCDASTQSVDERVHYQNARDFTQFISDADNMIRETKYNVAIDIEKEKQEKLLSEIDCARSMSEEYLTKSELMKHVIHQNQESLLSHQLNISTAQYWAKYYELNALYIELKYYESLLSTVTLKTSKYYATSVAQKEAIQEQNATIDRIIKKTQNDMNEMKELIENTEAMLKLVSSSHVSSGHIDN